jgi:hypothetical protein
LRIRATCSKFLVVLVSAFALCAHADEIEVIDARLATSDEGLLLSADFAFDFNERLQEAVANGVPLHFVIEFELSRPRWWWFDEQTAYRHTQWRLSYHALTRQYRLTSGALHQHFATLEEALDIMRRLRNWQVLERSVSLTGASYEVAVRMRLDTAQLPRPLQVSALTNRELRLESPWKQFIFRPVRLPAVPPPAPAPAPTTVPPEAKQPQGSVAR